MLRCLKTLDHIKFCSAFVKVKLVISWDYDGNKHNNDILYDVIMVVTILTLFKSLVIVIQIRYIQVYSR